jgi:hypothetical protein
MFERRGAEIIAWFVYGLGFCVGGMYLPVQCDVSWAGTDGYHRAICEVDMLRLHAHHNLYLSKAPLRTTIDARNKKKINTARSSTYTNNPSLPFQQSLPIHRSTGSITQPSLDAKWGRSTHRGSGVPKTSGMKRVSRPRITQIYLRKGSGSSGSSGSFCSFCSSGK